MDCGSNRSMVVNKAQKDARRVAEPRGLIHKLWLELDSFTPKALILE